MKPSDKEVLARRPRVNNILKRREQLLAHQVVNSLSPQIYPAMHRLSTNQADRAYLRAWHKLGAEKATVRESESFISTPPASLSPLGQACLFCYALGRAGEPAPAQVLEPPPPPSRRRLGHARGIRCQG
jgi:hypothetical protein